MSNGWAPSANRYNLWCDVWLGRMGFLNRLFGQRAEAQAAETPKVDVVQASTDLDIPAAKVGLDGKFDESGLAKRVAKALDDANISDDVGLWVAQRGSTVVLKFNEDARAVLARAQEVALTVEGATAVEVVPNT